MPDYRLIYTITVQIKVSYYHCPIDPSILQSASLSTPFLQSSLIFRLKVSILSLYVRTSIGVCPGLADRFPISLEVGFGSASLGTLTDSSGSVLSGLPWLGLVSASRF